MYDTRSLDTMESFTGFPVFSRRPLYATTTYEIYAEILKGSILSRRSEEVNLESAVRAKHGTTVTSRELRAIG